MTVIYVDTVFLLNGVLDYLLLRSVAGLAVAPFRRLRLLAAGALGGAYAVLVFLPGLEWLAWPVCRVLWGAVMTGAAFGRRRGWLRLFLLLLALSCALAGVLLLVAFLWPAGLTYPNGIPVSGPDWKALLLAGAVCYWLCCTVLRRLAPERGKRLLPVRLEWGERHVWLTALEDTGNLLTDPSGSGPVLVAFWETVRPILPGTPELRREDVADPVAGIGRIGTAWGVGRLRLLPYRGVGVPSGLLLAVRVDRADLDGSRVERQLVALTPEPFTDGDCQGIIGI
ncbi:MAG: sigma-E processing peptidase SpoIIGA [Clostridiales bacterium]|nr:sigma-E processing peptidase SpoIIGA [Clostridiales bacterium]